MQVIRDEKRIERMRRLSQYMTLIGLAALVGGLVLAFTMDSVEVFIYQLIALAVGLILSQIGVYLGHRYVRRPRPDQVLDEAVKKVMKNGRMYHYILPASHVLLTPRGIILFLAKYQVGEIKAEGDKWTQKGIGLRRFFGQESLGNPSREAQIMVERLANFLRKNAPEVEEVPIAALIVFTTKEIKSLDVANANFPAMHYSKVKGYLKQQWQNSQDKMDRETYTAVQAAFDRRAEGLEPQKA
ncbi:MAG: nuclease-related domain-containing protein [Chloroflexota bacterium]